MWKDANDTSFHSEEGRFHSSVFYYFVLLNERESEGGRGRCEGTHSYIKFLFFRFIAEGTSPSHLAFLTVGFLGCKMK